MENLTLKLIHFFVNITLARMMQITLKYGLSVYASGAFSLFGSVLCIYFKEKKGLNKYKDVALSLLNENSEKQHVSMVYCATYALMDYWFEHINLTIEPLQLAYKTGRESGKNDFAVSAAITYCHHSFYIGTRLDHLYEDMKQLRNEFPAKYIEFESLFTTVEKFLDINRQDCRPEIESAVQSKNKQTFRRNSNFILRAYYFHDYDSAADLVSENKLLNKEFYVGSIDYQLFIFYSGLVALQLVKRGERKSYWLQIADEHLSLMKFWAATIPENFENKKTLLEAEFSAAVGNKVEARALFEKAIYLSKKYSFLNDEALANERAGIFCLENNFDKTSTHFKKALELYEKWDAEAKVRHIESLYSSCISQSSKEDTQICMDAIEVNGDLCSEITNEFDVFSEK